MKEYRHVIFVGDSRNVVRRMKKNHSSKSNVEASALRRFIAEDRGLKLKITKRLTSNSKRIRIDLPDPSSAEGEITSYVRSGKWKYVLCDTYDEANTFQAHDFQWFVIEQLKPLLNRASKPWKQKNFEERYRKGLQELVTKPLMNFEQLSYRKKSGPGVYVFYHDFKPSEFHQ